MSSKKSTASKYHVWCVCTNCGIETTKQSLKAHFAKCTRDYKTSCINCGVGTNNKKFCGHSCRASFTNVRRCKKPIINKQELRNTKLLQRFLDGKISQRVTLRKYLSKTVGYKCDNCNLEKWDDKEITLVVDHKDGNAGNNLPNNLRLLCPNCNSQTETFSGRNKGNGRKARGLKLS